MTGARILVVDDNLINRKLVSDLLAYEGHDLHAVGDAEEALRVLGGPLPDLILMDIALPGMDGLTLTGELRRNPRTRGILIVALTAFAMKGDLQKAIVAGCDGYITKPINTRTLPSAVAGVLALRNHDFRGEEERTGTPSADSGRSGDRNFEANGDHPHEVIVIELQREGDTFGRVRRLRADPRTRDIPVVAVTSSPQYFSKAEALAAGCDSYFVKPGEPKGQPGAAPKTRTAGG